jgi:hypothetical protein
MPTMLEIFVASVVRFVRTAVPLALACFFLACGHVGADKGQPEMCPCTEPVAVRPAYILVNTPSSAPAGSTVSVDWQAPVDHDATDWIGISPVGAAATEFGSYVWVPAGTGGTAKVVVPASARGMHELRYYLANGYSMAAKSAAFEVTTPSEGYSLGPVADVAAGSALSISFQTPSGHVGTDWIGLYQAGAPATDFKTFVYVPEGRNGSVSLTVPPTAAGAHELRYYLANDYVLAASSAVFQVIRPSAPARPEGYSLGKIGKQVAAGAAVEVGFKAPADHAANDWIGLFAVGSEGTDYVVYVVVPSGPGGSVQLVVPEGTQGPHELRYYLADGYDLAAKSAPFEVVGNPPR